MRGKIRTMSIIYEALKKAEKAINFNANLSSVNKDKDPKSQLKLRILYTLVAAVALVMAHLGFGLISKPKNPAKKHPDSVSVAQNPIEQPKPVVIPAQNTPAAGAPTEKIQKKLRVSLILNGIFFSEDQGYALINNRIVKEGDVIEGVTVERITLDEVELDAGDGHTIKLSTNTR